MYISVFSIFFGVVYSITFAVKCFALAVAAVNAKLRSLLCNEVCKICTISAPLG